MSLDKALGQEQAEEYLRRSIESDKTASSYIVTGKAGLGKLALAKAFAKALNCEKNNYFRECSCKSCGKIEHESHPDIHCLGMDEAKSIKIAEIRRLQNEIYLKPYEGRCKVFIINGAERLTEQAQNALLKVLEEPPKYSSLILLTNNKSNLLNTVVSRCIEIRLHPLPTQRLAEILKNEMNLGEEAEFLATEAEGSIGRALELYEDEVFEFNNELLNDFLSGNKDNFFDGLNSLKRDEGIKVIQTLKMFFRDVLLLKVTGDARRIANKNCLAQIERLEAGFTAPSEIQEVIKLLDETENAFNRNVNQKLAWTRLNIELSSRGVLKNSPRVHP